jgi:predicted CxxxxCH...CXXCH cytochrome family protein
MSFRTLTRRLALALAVAALGAACQSRMPLPPPQQPPVDPPPADPTACDACHGAPPATGAHLLHSRAALRPALAYGDLAVLEDFATGGTAYGFGCGNCHPLDPALHLVDAGGDGAPDVELAPPTDGSAAGSLRAKNSPYAKWDPATGTCRGVYCHSSGQAEPDYVETPPWTAAPGTLGCNGCHGNPPRYPSAGADSAAPNGHLQLTWDGWEWGHYAGLPGPYHESDHGSSSAGTAAAPMTCQTCHFDTVDPANVGPDGFYYLDTSGDYALVSDGLSLQCATCHDGVGAPVGRGKVLPLRHVNGRRDVAFDPRTALPDAYPTGLPALASAGAIAPYYVAPFRVDASGFTLPPGGVILDAQDGTKVLAIDLARATYDPATRTCANIACHLARQQRVDAGAPEGPLRWGAPYVKTDSCNGCHSFY